METLISIRPDGAIVFLHADPIVAALRPVAAGVKVRRASHVEPTDDGTGWIADLSPVNGPTLGPFESRDAALKAEAAWIEERIGQITI